MLRLRTTVPILLLSSLATPAVGDASTSHCAAAPGSPRCEAEQAREFAKARNAEIEASLAAVAANRARLAALKTHCKSPASTAPRCLAEQAQARRLALTHCKTASSTAPRCLAERTYEFAKARNAEVEASLAAVKAERAHRLAVHLTHCKSAGLATPRCLAERKQELALARTHCKLSDSTTPRCQEQRARHFAAARNAEIEASIARVNAERTRTFAAARNAEIERSIAVVNAERGRAMALAMSHCKSANATSPRCVAQRKRDFAAAQNAQIERSIAAVNAERARIFAKARNSEIELSIARVDAERTRAFAAARNAEIERSLAAVAFNRARNAEIERSVAAVEIERARRFAAEQNAQIERSIARSGLERARKFAAARNAEIERSVAAVNAERALRLAMAQHKNNASSMTLWETGAIGSPAISADPRPQTQVKRTARVATPCRAAGRPLDPLHFVNGGTELSADMKSTLNQLAMIAKACPAVHVQVHGYTDAQGPAQVRRFLSHRRAHAARDFLVSVGVDAWRVSAIGHGDADPVMPNSTSENRARNRRIEIQMMDPTMEATARRIMWDLADLLDPTYVPPLAQLSP
jgi:outer membrane protein OmpA-like peptidoglycan-associated protein